MLFNARCTQQRNVVTNPLLIFPVGGGVSLSFEENHVQPLACSLGKIRATNRCTSNLSSDGAARLNVAGSWRNESAIDRLLSGKSGSAPSNFVNFLERTKILGFYFSFCFISLRLMTKTGLVWWGVVGGKIKTDYCNQVICDKRKVVSITVLLFPEIYTLEESQVIFTRITSYFYLNKGICFTIAF